MKHKHYDVALAYAEGKSVQYFELDKNPQGKWVDYTSDRFPDFNSTYFLWRVKPKITKLYQFLYRNTLDEPFKLTQTFYRNVDEFEYFQVLICKESEIILEEIDN